MADSMADSMGGALAMAKVVITLFGEFTVTVDGRPVDANSWTRRHAAGLVKVLSLAPGRRMHREQLIDRLWPDDTVDAAVPKLHKAAHFARKAIDVPDSIVLRGEHVHLCPDHDVVVDVTTFDELGRQAVSAGDAALAHQALALYRGELLPQDRYDEWAEERREQLHLRHLDLLRLDGQWEAVVEIDPSDEVANVSLMRRYAAAGDRHAAIRQFERLDRHLRRELGVAPGREAMTLRDRLLADPDIAPQRDRSPIGRDREMAVVEQALIDSGLGRSRTVLLSGPAGIGKSSLLSVASETAREMGFRVAHGTSAPVEGAWPYAPVVEALADLCRRHPTLLDGLADHHRDEIDRALSGLEIEWNGASSHQRLFVAAAELLRLASATHGLLLTIDDIHDADDASLRLIHFLARSTRDDRVCIVLALRPMPVPDTVAETRRSLLERHGAVELVLGPLLADEVEVLVRRYVPDPSSDLLERIDAIGRGVPFAVNELARRVSDEPGWAMALDTQMIAGISPATRDILQRVAVVGVNFDTDEFVALSGLPELAAFDYLDLALAASVIEPASSGYRFRHGLVREALLADLPPHRRRLVHRDAADRLAKLGASPARIGHHLLESGATTDAVPYLLRAAETEAAIGAYRDALALVDSVRPHAVGVHRARALSLRGDLLNAIGDPMAAAAYREALEGAVAEEAPRLRAKLARTAVMSGDLHTAVAVLDGLELDGGDNDADILLARGNLAFFMSDFEAAAAASEEAQRLVLAGERNWKVLDLVALQGFIAHLSGNWFDRMRFELRRTRDNPEVANAIFDGHLCAAEYLLYGPTPYAEVIGVGRDLKQTARRSGALRASAFAAALIGEAALLSGDLDLAELELREAADLHRDLGSPAGESHSLQRLAEVRIAQGDNAAATQLLHQALPLARGSMIANHLMQRIFGTLIVAAPDAIQARAVVDRAESTLGWDEVCPFCSIMLAVPAAIACAQADDLEHAERHLGIAERSGALWVGTAWEAALAEARAAVAAAAGDGVRAREMLRQAIERFDLAGQPLDADRCRRALVDA
jgi:DNA-binding SARP family transcriptional activator/tetratricopeptide (TPR) repeat protein